MSDIPWRFQRRGTCDKCVVVAQGNWVGGVFLCHRCLLERSRAAFARECARLSNKDVQA